MVMDSKGYTTTRGSLIGGKIVTSDTSSVGFLLSLYFDGRIRWQKTFNTDDAKEDIVEHVDTYEGLSYAAISSKDENDKIFFVIQFDTDGSVLVNRRLGNYPAGYFFTSLSLNLVDFVVHDSGFLSATFQRGLFDFSCFQNLGTEDQEYFIGLQDAGATNMHVLTSAWPNQDLINMMVILNEDLYHLAINGTNTVTESIQHLMNGESGFKLTAPIYDVSWARDFSYYW